jgi:hypothetical protein
MDLERFQEFMLQSAARHDSEMAVIRESLGRITNTVDRLVDNQVYLQESMDLLTRKLVEETEAREKSREQAEHEIQELRRVVFRHVTDPDAHQAN